MTSWTFPALTEAGLFNRTLLKFWTSFHFLYLLKSNNLQLKQKPKGTCEQAKGNVLMQVKTFKFTDGFAGKAVCCPGFILQVLAVPDVLKNARTIKFLYFVGLSDFCVPKATCRLNPNPE